MRTHADDRLTQPLEPPTQPKTGDDGGPTRPDIARPENNELLRRLKKVDPKQAERYRQRSGQ